ncbi:MAG: HAMP domain-containing sensor histidine kinase, partial [Anaerolineae bacterium]|nr:HAMP domain-containing sensor histidine kinase [Anaerolineae bacterium]
TWWWTQLQRHRQPALAPHNLLANCQVAADWLALTLLLHWTGGIESPLSPFYVLHVVVACVLLSPRAAFLHAALASLLLASLAGLEYAGIWPHHPLPGYLATALYRRPPFVVGILFFFTSSLFGCTFLATSVTRSLRRQDVELIGLQSRLGELYRRTRALYETALVLSSSLQLNEILGRMTRTTAEIMDAKGCSIRLLTKDGSRLELAAAYGLSDAYLAKGPVEVSHSPIDQDALQRRTVIVLNAPEDPRLQYHAEVEREGIRSILCSPLVAKDRAIGVIRVYSSVPHLYTQEDAAFLEAVASAGAVAIDNARAYGQLEELDQAKSRFVRLVAHQLRSPLAGMQSLLDVMVEGHAGEVGPRGIELLHRVQRRVQFLLALVNDLLELAAGRLDSLQRQRTVVDLQAVTERVAALLQARATSRQVALVVDVKPGSYGMWGIADHLEGMLTNLLDNAVKYTPSGGQVSIGLERDGDELLLTVADTGIGIPAEALPHVFEEFYRAPNARALEREGTGLGLPIAKQVIDEHGGRVDVQSQVGIGTVFTIALPARLAHTS